MDILKEKLVTIDSLNTKLNESRPLPNDIEEKMKNWFNNEIIHNSILGKCYDTKERELLENAHKEALNYIEELSKCTAELNISDIINIHFILFRNICPNYAGKYVKEGERWIPLKNGERHIFSDPSLIPEEMNIFFKWLFSIKKEHSLIIAAEAHNKLVKIHPFIDGNGRTGRLLMNLILKKNGYIPIIIKAFNRSKYEDTINSWQNGNVIDFYSFIADCEIDSLNTFLREIG